ncbi:MAG: hypothetical protein F6K48_10970 [Okeania sp. SIO3H1]|nr:hypothetical protein [Okeania sp. SIO3H1]
MKIWGMELTKSEVRSQPTRGPRPWRGSRGEWPFAPTEVNPPLAPPPPRRGGRGFELCSKNISP